MGVLRWILFLCALSLAAGANEAKIERGEIEGAKFTWLQPKQWNRHILLLAHGYRAEGAPLVADLFPTQAAYRKLWDEGWIVAKSSYRRNGTIVADAIEDLDNLRAEIVRRYGSPEQVLIEGDSMGGTIALAMAERPVADVPLYQGVIAIDAAFDIRESNGVFSGLLMQPKIPVALLCNRSEFEASRRYAQLNLPRSIRPNTPALFRVNRDGHVNVNQAERLAAVRALTAWVDSGRDVFPLPAPTDIFLDLTKIPDPQPSRVEFDQDQRGFSAHIQEISGVYGNLLLDAQAEDFQRCGIPPNAHFQVELNDENYRVLYGKDFTSVKRGQWVAFLNADGFFWLGRNFANAGERAQVELGDSAHIRRYDDPPARADP